MESYRPADQQEQGLSVKEPEKAQIQKFKEAARKAETDDSEEHFDRTLKKVAKPPKSDTAKAK